MTVTIASVSGEHIFAESGLFVVLESGIGVTVASGLPVNISGQPVTISGDHVFVESGVYVIAQVNVVVSGVDVTVNISGDPVSISGQPVTISGDHVYVESGAVVGVSGQMMYISYCLDSQGNRTPTQIFTDCSGRPFVWISGQHLYVESGLHVITQPDISISGQPVTISGDHVYVESGAVVGVSGQLIQAHVISGVMDVNIGASGVVSMSGNIINISGIVSVSGNIVSISGQHLFVESGAYVKNVMTDTRGDIAEIDATVQTLEMITIEHHEVHAGEMYRAFAQTSGLADDSVLDLLVVTGSGKEVHSIFEYACAGDAWLEVYENVLLSGSPGGSGEPVTINCMNRFISGTPTSTVYKDPYVVVGERIDLIFIPGETGNRTAGGEGRGANEWILNGVSGPENYLARIKNVAGAAKDANISIEFYEKTPGYP